MYDAYTPSEVALRMPVEVTSLSFEESTHSVLASGQDGHLYVYSISADRRGFELTNTCKTFHKNAVLELNVCQREDLLLCVSDAQLMAHKLSDPEYKVETLIHKVKPVVTFARFTPKTSADLYVIVSSRKKLVLFKWGERDGNKEFLEVLLDYNTVFTDTPSFIRCVGEMIFFSVKNEYFTMTMQKVKTSSSESPEEWNGLVSSLLTCNCPPGIIPMNDRNRVGFVRNETVVTTDFLGTWAPDEYMFSEVPMQVVYDSPYLIAMLSQGRVEVRHTYDNSLIQSVALPGSRTLCNGAPGEVYVAGLHNIWRLNKPRNVRFRKDQGSTALVHVKDLKAEFEKDKEDHKTLVELHMRRIKESQRIIEEANADMSQKEINYNNAMRRINNATTPPNSTPSTPPNRSPIPSSPPTAHLVQHSNARNRRRFDPPSPKIQRQKTMKPEEKRGVWSFSRVKRTIRKALRDGLSSQQIANESHLSKSFITSLDREEVERPYDSVLANATEWGKRHLAFLRAHTTNTLN